jgi:hypothetical protein
MTIHVRLRSAEIFNKYLAGRMPAYSEARRPCANKKDRQGRRSLPEEKSYGAES